MGGSLLCFFWIEPLFVCQRVQSDSVSRAIINSSSVGMTHTFTELSSALMMASVARQERFLASSSFTPINSSPVVEPSRTSH